MTIYDSEFWHKIESARGELGGSYYMDPDTGHEHNFPSKDQKKYAKAYDYCLGTMGIFMIIGETIEEIKLIKIQIQTSQDFALQHPEFSTDSILKFSYKNWIIRINMLVEQLISLTNTVYTLKLPQKDRIEKIFNHERVRNDVQLYLKLLNLIDFLKDKIFQSVDAKTLKQARNEIVHNGNFSHLIIQKLSFQLFEYKHGISDITDSEDIYLAEGQASEKIKNEILTFSHQFLEKCNPLFSLLTDEFYRRFTQLTQALDSKS